MDKKQPILRLPVVALGAEYLVMGHLMRRNVLAYKAPPNNEGYDLIAIHPDPRHTPKRGERAQLRIQVKSRYATDSNRTVLVAKDALDAFEFLVVAFLNIGKFYGRNVGLSGEADPRYYALPQAFVRKHHVSTSGWEKLPLKHLEDEIAQFEGNKGWDAIALALGVERPRRQQITDLDQAAV